MLYQEAIDMGGAPEIYFDSVAEAYQCEGVTRCRFFSWQSVGGILRRVVVLTAISPGLVVGTDRVCAIIPHTAAVLEAWGPH